MIGGRYELDARIGTGGMGEVWRARHVALNSFVAIKFLQGASAQNEATRRRFTTEAQVTAQLKSRHAVQVFDFGVTDDGQPYLVMELLEGETLGRRVEREGRVGVVETARILGQSARALHRAHQLGIVHRDFKPDNIVIDADEEGRDYVKVLDFGVAKLVGDLDPPSNPSEDDFRTTAPPVTFTRTGAMLGTPAYMAPEQITSPSDVDLRADIWAFGVVAFECLTGCTPFTGDTLRELFEKIESGTHPPPNNFEPSIPAGFQEWFDTACAPDPRKRFADVNTAYKRLLVALDCGRVDLEPSMKLGRSLSASGEGHVVGHSMAGSVDSNAVTMDAPKKGVEPRHNRAHRKTANVPAPVAVPPPPSPPESDALTATIADDRDDATRPRKRDQGVEATVRRSRTVGGRAWALVAIPLLALAGVAAWRLSTTPAPSPAPAPAEAPVAPSAASPAPRAAPVASASQPPVVTTPSPPAASASSTPPKPSTPRPRLHQSAAVPSVTGVSAPSAAAPPAVPPPAVPPPAPADPGSYR